MGNKNKKGVKGNVFKVAGAKSLKKTKAKAVNLGLKNIKRAVQAMDKEFLELSKLPKPKPTTAAQKPTTAPQNNKKSKKAKKVTKEEVAIAAEEIIKMDL